MRLAVNKLTTLEHEILKHLKKYCVGKENAIKGWILASSFNIGQEKLRRHLSNIKKYQEVIIGSDKKEGYYIPLEKEKDEALAYSENKTLGHLENSVMQNPSFVLRAYKLLNKTLAKAPKEIQNQIRMQLTGYENETVNYYGDKYLEKTITNILKEKENDK